MNRKRRPADGVTHNIATGSFGQALQARDIYGDVYLNDLHIPFTPLPRQLPPVVTNFMGRVHEIGKLDALLNGRSANDPLGASISVIAGIAGIGKTSLAVHCAHRALNRFPDGQFFVNLRGYDPGPPLAPIQVLGSFIRALGVQSEGMPSDLDSMIGLYRSLTANCRLLVVLDNASTADQIRPLLPSAATCSVLVTSRSRLSGLVARDGAHRIVLDLLDQEESIGLLKRILGTARIDEERVAASELVRRCGYLPLALRIASERLANNSKSTITSLVNALDVRHSRLDVLVTEDDEYTAVRTVFSWSYHGLSPDLAKAFRLLSVHPGSTISVACAAAIIGCTIAHARKWLKYLTSVNMLEEVACDRYRLHDLVREYAAECLLSDESEPDSAGAVRRLFTWYLQVSYSSQIAVNPHYRGVVDVVVSDVESLIFADQLEAIAWYDAEYDNLLDVIRRAPIAGHPEVAWKLPYLLSSFMGLRHQWIDRIAVHRVGLTAAQESNDKIGERWSYVSLGEALMFAGEFADAKPCHLNALALARESEDSRAEAAALYDLGFTDIELGYFDDAVSNLMRALEIFQEIGSVHGQGVSLWKMADAYRGARRLDDALNSAQKSLSMFREVQNRWSEAYCLSTLGRVHFDMGNFDQASILLRRSSDLFQVFFDSYESAKVLDSLGIALKSAGKLQEAFECWRRALSVFIELESPLVEQVRLHLEGSGF